MSAPRIAIQMDPPSRLNLAMDSTIALAQEAARRGFMLYAYQPEQLAYQSGALHAVGARLLQVDSEDPTRLSLGEAQSLMLEEMQAVLMRQDPPFDMTYLSATYLLEQLRVPVLNHPAYVRNHPEKLAILRYPEAIPPTLVSASTEAILAFREAQGAIVVKPLYGFGGRSIYRFERDDSNLLTLLEQWQQHSAEPLMVQRFLPEVAQRDVRVILMDGAISAAVGRIPASGEIRANFRVGGTAAAVELNDTQRAHCERVGADLKRGGVVFAGLDLIGDYLTEINITSPTGIRAAQALYGHDPSVDFWNAVEANYLRA